MAGGRSGADWTGFGGVDEMEAEAENKGTRGKKKQQQIEGPGRCAASCVFAFHGSNDETRKEACFFGAWLFPCLPRIPFHSNWFEKGNDHTHPASAALSSLGLKAEHVQAGRRKASPLRFPREMTAGTLGLGGKEANQRGQETERGTPYTHHSPSAEREAVPHLRVFLGVAWYLLQSVCLGLKGRVQAERYGTMRKDQRVLACGRICARPGIHRGIANFRGPQASLCLSSNPTPASASAASRNTDTASQRLQESSIFWVCCFVAMQELHSLSSRQGVYEVVGHVEQLTFGTNRSNEQHQCNSAPRISAAHPVRSPIRFRRDGNGSLSQTIASSFPAQRI
ncbi:hypothetical protein CKAH01_17881 [Colletotrichum kahawae]|uniref:Uncharacterized protein n=1 Tax=Colletotrichum kahawae TaxID=34407 RepID=A0AAD9Y8V9_COLKA|nr:hypothetical protein CKAH01_17881 [Colletotrichum kahawae]